MQNVSSWKYKGLSEESIKPAATSDNSISPFFLLLALILMILHQKIVFWCSYINQKRRY